MASRHIIGITLHIASNGDEPAQILTFMKDKTRTVTIGRRSTQARHSRASTHDTALFRCPVISRRHAQITFLEDGTVSVKDLNSHHGTHIRKPIQISSTPVLPNDPRPLENLDIITFGKSVGRDETYVRPMVAKVRMHYALSPSASSPAFATPLSTISGPGPAQSTTGRYGLVAPSTLSDSSDSEDDSDVEEIPARSSDAAQASYSNHFPLFSPMPPMQMPRPSGFGLFNNYFSSRAYSPSHAPQVEEQDDNDEEGVVEEVRTPSNRLSPIEVSSASPSRSPSVVEIQAPSQSQEQGQAAEVVTGEWSSPSSSPEPQHGQDRESLEYEEPSLQLPADPIAYECGFWQYQHLVNSQIHFQNASTSAVLSGLSPCDPHNAVNEMPHYALVNATAPDLSMYDNLPEPRHSPEPEREQSPEDMQLSDDEDGAPQLVPAAQFETERAPEPIEEQVKESSQSSADVAPERQPEFTPTPELAQGGIETRIEQLKTTIAELGERMSQDSANVNAPQALSDTSGDATQSQPEPERTPEDRVQPEAQGASSTELVVDVQNVVQVALQELRAEQETLKASFAETAELVKQVKSLVVVQQNCKTPLKRKRDELTVDDDDDDGNDADERYRARPLKRRRSLAVRVASGVAKTTAIAALGAVATWSALAFS